MRVCTLYIIISFKYWSGLFGKSPYLVGIGQDLPIFGQDWSGFAIFGRDWSGFLYFGRDWSGNYRIWSGLVGIGQDLPYLVGIGRVI